MDVLIALPTIGQVAYDGTNNWLGNDRYKTYVRLRKGSTPDDLKEGMERMLEVNHVTEEMIRKEREEILNAGQEEIRALADVVAAMLAADQLCVIGSEEKIEEQKALFGEVRTLF